MRQTRKRLRSELDFKSVKFRRKDGFLSVEPYPFVHKTFAKERWLGQNLLDVFTKEFIGKDRDYYTKCIEDERIMVNGSAISKDYMIQSNDILSHACICEENPVLDEPIKVIAETDDLLVVSKPSSIPIHACGVYKYLTVVSLLQHEGRTHPILTLHRLDRLTSGLVLLAKTKDSAKHITELFTQHKVRKTYLCRVRGDFRLCRAEDKFAVTVDDDGVTVKGFIVCVDPTVGVQILDEKEGRGKPAETLFQFDAYDAETDESIVRAYPRTGRTHQIRVHLRHLGYPISNDPNYGVEASEHCASIYLHAWRYCTEEWDFQTDRPDWAVTTAEPEPMQVSFPS